MKLQIIETADYILAVSDETKSLDSEKIKNEYYLGSDNKIHRLNETNLLYFRGKIIAYLPKNNSPELDLPLLPEMVIEDDVEKLAYRIYPAINTIDENGNDLDLNYGYRRGFEEGFKYKAATKVYSEEDLRNAIAFGINTQYTNLTPKGIELEIEKFIQSFKQSKTPKWFVVEMEKISNIDSKPIKIHKNIEPIFIHDSYSLKLKTTINKEGKKVLVGTYLYE
jgi:hypothetical protein